MKISRLYTPLILGLILILVSISVSGSAQALSDLSQKYPSINDESKAPLRQALGQNKIVKKSKFTGKSYAIFGQVTDFKTKKALSRVRVRLFVQNTKTGKWSLVNSSLSDKNGNYGLIRLDPKKVYALRVNQKGYQTFEYRNPVPEKANLTINIALSQ